MSIPTKSFRSSSLHTLTTFASPTMGITLATDGERIAVPRQTSRDEMNRLA